MAETVNNELVLVYKGPQSKKNVVIKKFNPMLEAQEAGDKIMTILGALRWDQDIYGMMVPSEHYLVKTTKTEKYSSVANA